MKFLTGLFKFIAYPLVRPLSDAKTAATQLGKDVSELRRLKEERRARGASFALEPREGQDVDLSNYTAEQLANPKLIADDAERFDVVARVNEITPKELDRRRSRARFIKRVMLWLLPIVMVLGFIAVARSPLWMALFAAPMLVCVCGVLLSQAVVQAMFQSQLELKRLHSFKAYLSRPDFVGHLLG